MNLEEGSVGFGDVGVQGCERMGVQVIHLTTMLVRNQEPAAVRAKCHSTGIAATRVEFLQHAAVRRVDEADFLSRDPRMHVGQ